MSSGMKSFQCAVHWNDNRIQSSYLEMAAVSLVQIRSPAMQTRRQGSAWSALHWAHPSTSMVCAFKVLRSGKEPFPRSRQSSLQLFTLDPILQPPFQRLFKIFDNFSRALQLIQFMPRCHDCARS